MVLHLGGPVGGLAATRGDRVLGEPGQYVKYTGWVKKKWDLKKIQIALTHSILKLKSIVIPLNKMSQSGEKHAQD